VIYGLLVALAMLPPMTEAPYNPRKTHDVILSILRVSVEPYASWGWVFHVATVAVIALSAARPRVGGRALAVYVGLNYLIVAALQTSAETDKYGFAVQTGALIGTSLLGLVWLSVAWRGTLRTSFERFPSWSWTLLPLALLVFWSPMALEGEKVVPDFDPLLLLTSPGYGLTYCFVTPVFLFLLILAYPGVDRFAFRVTAFNGFIYGLLNTIHWFDPDLAWMGVMHAPLLIISLVALFLPILRRDTPQSDLG
jgi:hypothetical protein